MLNKGVWDKKQILSRKWVKESISPSIEFNEHRGYGYQWWVPEYENGQTKIFAGNGYGGQFLMMAPEYDMLVLFNGWNIHSRTEKSTWRVLQNRILPKTQL